MDTFALLAVLAFGGDIDRLGSDDYGTRERAARQLQSCGLLCRPLLLDAARSHRDPEVRSRAAVILSRQEPTLRTYRPAIILSGLVDVPPDWWDSSTRRIMWRIAQDVKCDTCYPTGHKCEWKLSATWRLNPDYDHHVMVSESGHWTTADKCNAAMKRVRAHLAGVEFKP